MKIPEIPENEIERLNDLRSLNILDTQAEERFDRITRMAKRMFNVPIALVSLIDENRQWFKSCFGVEAKETPRDISFCGHAILGDDIFLIEDATQDERFSDNPLVTEAPFIKFYAGCPIKLPNNRKMGTLCIIDSKPRIFGEEDLELLKDLAIMVENELISLEIATVDELTKISNRRGFLMLGEKSLAFSKRNQFPVCLSFFDLDNFKPINDKFGHKEGDHALKMFSKLMIKNIRESDIFARLGGDEFVTLFTNISKENAEHVVSEFKKTVDEYNKTAQKSYNILFSHGTVEYDKDKHHDIEDLINEADKFMYEYKNKRDNKGSKNV